MTPQQLNDWRVVPRLLILLYGFICWHSYTWFTGLEAPTVPQQMYASVIWGASAAWFGLYVNSGGVSDKSDKNRD